MASSLLLAATTAEVGFGCIMCSEVAAVPAVGEPLVGLHGLSFMLAAAPVMEKALLCVGIRKSLGWSGCKSWRLPSDGKELGRADGVSM